MPSLTSLAEEILANAKQLDKHLDAQKQPSPSFDHDALIDLSPQLESVRETLVNSTHTLMLLTQGPLRATVDILFSWTDLLSLRALYACRLPQAVPIDGEASYQDIASASGISRSMARRFLRHAMANHIFAESAPNKVRHTAASQLMVTDSDFFDAIGLETCELGPESGSVIDAFFKCGDSGEPNENAFSLANGTDLSFYQFLAQHPERARRFGAALRFFTKEEGWNSMHLVAGFDWASIDHVGATVVDMGGPQVLARATQHIKFIIRDLPGTVEQGRAALPKQYDGRIEFMAHDFVAEQTLTKPPTPYLFRFIFHNWSDGYSIKILRNLIPSMDDSTRILIYETVLSDDPETKLSEKLGLNLDIRMAAFFIAAQRTKSKWVDLLQAADERFVVQNIVRPEGSSMNVIEAVWKGS